MLFLIVELLFVVQILLLHHEKKTDEKNCFFYYGWNFLCYLQSKRLSLFRVVNFALIK